MTMYEIHMLMNYPANVLNRDDTGTPKTVNFNGTQRIRISSQCLKRSWRNSPIFKDAFHEIGTRTRGLPELVGLEMQKRGIDEDTILACKKVIATGKHKNDDDPWMMDKMEFYSPAEVQMITDTVLALKNEKKPAEFAKLKYQDIAKLCGAKKAGITMDQAMFGRMVTDETVGNIDAAIQVAHAISTNAGALDSDYFTAVDDMIADGRMAGESVTGHMNDTDFDSGCFYEHVVIDMDQLKTNLKDNEGNIEEALRKVVPTFVKTMAYTSPSAKQNTFEAHVLPEVIYVVEKEDKIPVNMCNAFDRPTGRDAAGESIKKLADEVDREKNVYDISSLHAVWFKTRDEYATPKSNSIKVVTTMHDLMEEISSWDDAE